MRLPSPLLRPAKRAVRAVRRLGGPRAQRPPEIPSIPPGWHTGPPDFIGVGAQKAGTSWWSALLHLHPDVHSPERVGKEYHFFDRFWREPFTEADTEAYRALFPRPEAGIAGEWTPGYMVDFWAPALLARAAPEARLLVLLRDPIERYRSGITHTEGRGSSPTRSAAVGAYGRGRYAEQLERLYRYFPRDRVLVLQYERCQREPQDQLAATYRFLGLGPFQPPEDVFARRVNETPTRKLGLPEQVRQELIELYRPEVDRLAELAPGIDPSLWVSLRP